MQARVRAWARGLALQVLLQERLAQVSRLLELGLQQVLPRAQQPQQGLVRVLQRQEPVRAQGLLGRVLVLQR